MKPLAFVLAALLLAPIGAAAPPPPEFPEEVRALYARWLDAEEALVTDEDREQPWFDLADGFLQRAIAAEEAGRVREGMFHLETFHELLVTKRLMDEASSLANDADRRLFALERLRAVHSDAEEAWVAYREKLKGYDDRIGSLLSMELALYASETALSAALGAETFELMAGEFSRQGGFPEAYVLALARASHTSLLATTWADDMLDAATRQDGLPPQIVASGFANVSELALASGFEDPPPHLQSLEIVAKPVRENDEKIMSIAVLLSTQRFTRISSMQTIFGDAGARGKDVLTDATRFMVAAANNTTLETPRSFGLEGIFTSDALDRVALTHHYVEEGQASVDLVFHSWASLDQATYATGALARMSPIAPPPTPTNEAPGIGVLPLAALVVVLALAMRFTAARKRSK